MDAPLLRSHYHQRNVENRGRPGGTIRLVGRSHVKAPEKVSMSIKTGSQQRGPPICIRLSRRSLSLIAGAPDDYSLRIPFRGAQIRRLGDDMPQEVRLWSISKADRLLECAQASLNLEARLEEWLARDISILADDLLAIGRQVWTTYGGFIDLLCIDRIGDLVVVELKRDKTPRDVTAQTLDYASWVVALSRDDILAIASRYSGIAGSLEEAFRQRFGEELPESINESHRILIVASRIDPSSERIIKYLSNGYGVNINAVTFHYFKTNDSGE